jgi:hypothetical protein
MMMMIECELAFALLADIENMIVSMGCHAHFPRREHIIMATQSMDAVGQGLLQAWRHFQSFSLGDIPKRVVNCATLHAFRLLEGLWNQ